MNKLAIIIPYYKIDFFEETLQSVAAQTDKRFTLYIGNDASPNDPKNPIEKHFPEGNYNYYDYKENLGGKNLAMQWERILENVTEEWFQILGDDDMIAENFVEEFYKNLNKLDTVNFVKTHSEIKGDNDEIIYSKTNTINSGYYSAIQFFLNKISSIVNSSLSEHIFRFSAYKKCGFKKYPLAWHSDDFFLLDISKDQPMFYFLSETMVTIKQTEKSISGKNDNYLLKKQASIMFYKDVLALVKNNEDKAVIDTLTPYILKVFSINDAYTIFRSTFSPSKSMSFILNYKTDKFLSIKIIRSIMWRLSLATYRFKTIINPTIRKQRKDSLSIPVIIINYNQLFYLQQLVDFLLERNFKNIIIIDNKSDYPPLLDYYKIMEKKITIEHMSENFGFDVFMKNKELQRKYAKGYFFLTDSDIVPNKNLPHNFSDIMLNLLDKYYNNITKIGFALEINDIPEYYPLREKVQKWEKKHWSNEVEKDIYKSPIDTTFALYKPNFVYKERNQFLKALRMGGAFTAKHGGWYLNTKELTHEQLHYLKTTNESSSWRIDEKGNHLSTEYDKFIAK